MNLKFISAVCLNCGYRTLIKVPSWEKAAEFKAANCEKCQAQWKQEMDQVMKAMVSKI